MTSGVRVFAPASASNLGPGFDALGLAPHERITGFVHIGRPGKPPEDRPRPPLSDIVTYFGR